MTFTWCGVAQVDFHPFDPKRPPLMIPPHVSGIGSEEDSLQNVLHLVPRPPPKPYTDYLENWNKVLRFEAGLVPLTGPGGRPQQMEADDGERRWVVRGLLVGLAGVWCRGLHGGAAGSSCTCGLAPLGRPSNAQAGPEGFTNVTGRAGCFDQTDILIKHQVDWYASTAEAAHVRWRFTVTPPSSSCTSTSWTVTCE